MIGKFLLICMILFIISVLIGDLVLSIIKLEKSLLKSLVIGAIAVFAVYQLETVPMIFMKKKLIDVNVVWGGTILIIMLCAVVRILFDLKKVWFGFVDRLSDFGRKFDELYLHKKIILGISYIIMISIVIFQCYKYAAYQHIDDDDSRFVVNSVEAYQSGSILLNSPNTGIASETFIGELKKDVTSPWMIFIASLSKVFSISPTIMAHTILPVVLLILAYSIYWLIGKLLFNEDKILSAMLVSIIGVMNIFDGSSVYNSATFMLTRIWQGKAIVAAIMIPLIFYLLLNIYKSKKIDGNYLVLAIASTATCLMSGIGIYLSCIIIGCFTICYCIAKRRIVIIFPMILTCVPSGLYGLLYFLVSR